MTFKKGDDPNRYTNIGVMAFHKEVSEMIRERCPAVVDFIFDTVNDTDAPLKLRLRAAKECLDRGLGRPIDTTVHIAMSKDDELKDVSTLSDSELEALARRITTPTHDQESSVIDGEYSESQ